MLTTKQRQAVIKFAAANKLKPIKKKRKRWRRWAEALESGKYIQGTGRLYNKDNNSYCCLGVACDISKLGEWKGKFYVPKKGPVDNTQLPEEVANWLGTATNPLLVRDIGAIALNDRFRFTFEQIALLIRLGLSKGKK